jgi:hypothetical protein
MDSNEFEDSHPCDDSNDFIDEPFLYGDMWYGTADWYRKHYPGFDDEFYEVFEEFSSEELLSSVEFSSEHTINEVGTTDTHAEQQVRRHCVRCQQEV